MIQTRTYPEPLKPAWRQSWRRASALTFYLLPSTFCLLLAACSHPPQTAAELQSRLPSQYQGDLHLQGETDPHHIVIEAHELKNRETRLLEFGKVRYQFFTGTTLTADGEANIHGTISTPDLALVVESFGGEGGGEALKPGSFQGKLSKDLQTMEASWTTGFGQKVTLKAKAQP